jgi:hypothetical protein
MKVVIRNEHGQYLAVSLQTAPLIFRMRRWMLGGKRLFDHPLCTLARG